MRCRDILPWLTSANTLWAVWLNGHNVRLSWKVSLANQALWLVFIVAFGAWGLLPLTLSLALVFASHLTRPPKPTPAPATSRQFARLSFEARPRQLLGYRTTAAGATGDLGRMARQTSCKSRASGVDITG